jgi:hypothetical protein
MDSYAQPIPFKAYDGKYAKITNAAIRVGDTVYAGIRHANIMSYLREANLCDHVSYEMQGFVDADGTFFSRYQAQRIVWHTKQMPFGKKLAPDLLSEHLWDEDGKPVTFYDEAAAEPKKLASDVKPYVPVGYKGYKKT